MLPKRIDTYNFTLAAKDVTEYNYQYYCNLFDATHTFSEYKIIVDKDTVEKFLAAMGDMFISSSSNMSSAAAKKANHGLTNAVLVNEELQLVVRLYNPNHPGSPSDHVVLQVTAQTPEQAQNYCLFLKEKFFHYTPDKKEKEYFRMTFVNHDNDGYMDTRSPKITPNIWDDIKLNYSNNVGSAMEALFDINTDRNSGRIMLWHGPPGTGKTNAIKCLAYRWKHEYDSVYIIDPERFFGDPAYMWNVCSMTPYDYEKNESSEKHKLFILEDAGKFIDEKGNDGYNSLSKLLNIGDGLLAESIDATFLITTNEALVNIHPAISREGRCMANINFGKLSMAEGKAWMEAHKLNASQVEGEISLAELYSFKNAKEFISNNETELAPHGVYL